MPARVPRYAEGQKRKQAALSHDQLLRALDYNPDTGVFTWRVTRGRAVAGRAAGQPHSGGYIVIGVCGEMFTGHRLAWFYVYGRWPEGEIDHRNCVRSDNRISNLRVAVGAQQQANSRKGKNNKSGYKGVSWHAGAGRWRATTFSNYRQIHLGFFDDPEKAHRAYQVAVEAAHGEFARFE